MGEARGARSIHAGVPGRNPPADAGTFVADQLTIRPFVVAAPQRVYTPPRQGDIPARPARFNLFLSFTPGWGTTFGRDLFSEGPSHFAEPPNVETGDAPYQGKFLSYPNLKRGRPVAYGTLVSR